jgi:hypothetical protein
MASITRMTNIATTKAVTKPMANRPRLPPTS